MLCKIKFTVNAGLSKKIVVILFIIKVFAGVFNGWLSYQYLNADTWQYNNLALKEYYLLFSHPKEYFTNLFISTYKDNYSGILQSSNSYWNDLKTNLMVKIVSVFHIFSLGNYYVNVILYNFLIFFGNIALFKTFNYVYKDHKKILVGSCFLLPSFLFFGSSIHKEGLIIGALSIIIYIVYRALHFTGFSSKKLVSISFFLLFILLLRNYIFIALVPALIVWIFCEKKKYPPLKTFSIVYLLGSILFFSIGKIIPSLDLASAVVAKQQAFLSLEKANSSITVEPLTPGIKSFILNMPSAIINSLLRPFIFDGRLLKFLYPLAFEILLYEIIFIVFLFFRFPVLKKPGSSFIVFGIFFTFSMLLIIGFTTPVLGAIVRYRSIYLPFLITPVLCNISYHKILRSLNIKK